jgi:omega-6 fatty acid desaturase (delta-12 desaturase)
MTPRLGSAMFDLATSIIAYLALTAVMFVAAGVSFLLVLVLALPAAGFLVRTFIVFHDCAHGSFTRWKRANALLGGLLESFSSPPSRGGATSTLYTTRPPATSTAGAWAMSRP